MEMELKQAEAAIEAVLFTMGESVEVSKLAAPLTTMRIPPEKLYII